MLIKLKQQQSDLEGNDFFIHPSLRESIKIDEFWEVDKENWSAVAKKLAEFPAQRQVECLREHFLPVPFKYNLTAAVGQCVGRLADNPCTHCVESATIFPGGCVIWPGGIKKNTDITCCFNCYYQWKYSGCSFYDKNSKKRKRKHED
ncbi:hypothetical protein F5Y07DRAFT_308013 [Xylaria sp. FL0933]|nr:hypothetical protein F5Y07DRAFT_308013 [Xylaria sp. FL0933]